MIWHHIRLERLREHADDHGGFHDIDCVVQIQIQIVSFSAYEILIIIDWKDMGDFTHTAESQQTRDA